jgi:hypothetical protein
MPPDTTPQQPRRTLAKLARQEPVTILVVGDSNSVVGQLAFFRELAPHFNVPKYFCWEEVE